MTDSKRGKGIFFHLAGCCSLIYSKSLRFLLASSFIAQSPIVNLSIVLIDTRISWVLKDYYERKGFFIRSSISLGSIMFQIKFHN